MATTTLTPFVDFLKTIGVAEPDAELLSRFARSGDEAAFAELVRRHGPAVLGVCRRVVRDDHAAEDAFQATFLLLATKAGSLRNPELLANWLHGVAYRTAMKLRGRLHRRRLRERPFDENACVSPNGEADLRPDLDSAIQRLPSKYRVPVVLCYLQGLTNAEAAQRVGCPANTIATRLARARHRLRTQLARQGLTVAVSSALIAATARNAQALGAGATLSPNILTLMEGVRRAMFWNKLKIGVAALALVAMGGLGVGRISYRAGAGEPPGTGMPAAPSQQVQIPPPVADEVESKPEAETNIPPIDLSKPEEKSKNFSKNFVVKGVSPEMCEKIAVSAERARKDLAMRWLGKELPTWTKPCPITVHTDARLGSSSATTFEFDPKFTINGMELSGSSEQIFNFLRHEVTHTILADAFRKPVPRWADEGAATLSENQSEIQRYDALIRKRLKEGKALRLSHLFSLKDYPNDVTTFYSQSASVTAFLIDGVNLKGIERASFVRFVADGMERGWQGAVQGIYGFETIEDLERAWIAWLRKTQPKAAATNPPVQYAGSSPQPPQADLPPPTITPPPPQIPPLPSAANNYTSPPPGTAADPLIPRSGNSPAMQAPSVNPPLAPASFPSPPLTAAPGRMTVTTAMLDPEGRVVCKFAKTIELEPVTSYLADQSGKYREIRSYIRKITQEERSFDPAQLHVTGTDGREIDSKELPKRLQKETRVIFLANGQIDPGLLPLLKEGTLVISMRAVSPVPPPSVTPSR